MLKKVLLLSISLGTISNSISMDNVIYRYNIPMTSITMGTVVGFGSRLLTKNPLHNIGIGLGIGIGTYFISKLFGKDIIGKELDSIGNYCNNKSYKDIYNEIISNNRFYEDNPEHVDLFWKSAEKGLLNIFKDLISKGADINAKNNNGNTPLHIASYNGYLPIVEYLVNNRADINTKNKNDRTPLHYASFEGHLSVVELLINKGADKDAKDECDRTPLHIASIQGYFSVVEYLVNKGADKDAKDNCDRTPLHNASANGHLFVVEYLFNNGADINAKDNDGKTPLYWASIKGHSSVVEYLVNKGANKDAEVNPFMDSEIKKNIEPSDE